MNECPKRDAIDQYSPISNIPAPILEKRAIVHTVSNIGIVLSVIPLIIRYRSTFAKLDYPTLGKNQLYRLWSNHHTISFHPHFCNCLFNSHRIAVLSVFRDTGIVLKRCAVSQTALF